LLPFLTANARIVAAAVRLADINSAFRYFWARFEIVMPMMLLKNLSACFLLLFSFSILRAQSKNARSVLEFEARRFEAMTRADTAALRPMLADELVYVHSNALKENKLEHLSAIASRQLVYEKMEREQVSVRFYGKTALLNGTAKVQGILNGKAFELRLFYASVYRKKRGSWQLLNWQSTKIP
jgi:ketosteroid isomerase-like protein